MATATWKTCELCGKEWAEYINPEEPYCGGHRSLVQRVNWTKNQREKPGACPTPTKTAYHTKEQALAGASRKLTREKYGQVLRPYECACRYWHLTSAPIRTQP